MARRNEIADMLVAECEALGVGYELVLNGRKHHRIKVKTLTGEWRTVFFAKTPSDFRGAKNVLSQLRRTVK